MDVTNTTDLAAFHRSIAGHTHNFYLARPARKPELVGGVISYGEISYIVLQEGAETIVRVRTDLVGMDGWEGRGSNIKRALSALMNAHSDCPPLPAV